MIFPDPKTIKAMLEKPAYQVENLYKTTGVWQAIARNSSFQGFMFVIICLNSIWIGINTDYNKADVLYEAPGWIQFGENLFCLIFTSEIVIRFKSFESKRDAFTDGWFCFDLLLVTLMVWETWVEVLIVPYFHDMGGSGVGDAMVMRIFRLSRLSRISRIGRVSRFLREVPELSILTKALFYAARSVGATLLLLVVSIYIFAIFFTQMLAETEFGKGQFDSILRGMHTLLVQGILADQADLINGMLHEDTLYYVVILVYLLISSLTVANMLIGVICDLIGKVSEEKREENIKENMEQAISKIIFQLDADDNHTISKREFGAMLHNEEATRILHEEGVDVLALLGFVDQIFEEDGKELNFKDFMEIVLGFRETDASVKHLLDMKQFVSKKLDYLEGATWRKDSCPRGECT